jgi:SOS-response transcriptional repressor LexA
MENTLANNLHMLMSEKRLSSSELSRCINIPAVTIKKIRTGENKNPTISTLFPISNYFGITISQLIGEVALKENNKDKRVVRNREKVQAFPILKWSDAKSPFNGKGSTEKCYLVTESKVSTKAYALIIKDSETMNFTNGDLILVDPKAEPRHNDYALVTKDNSNPVLKKIIKDESGIYLKSLLKDISSVVQLENNYKILGTVVAYKKWLHYA